MKTEEEIEIYENVDLVEIAMADDSNNLSPKNITSLLAQLVLEIRALRKIFDGAQVQVVNPNVDQFPKKSKRRILPPMQAKNNAKDIS